MNVSGRGLAHPYFSLRAPWLVAHRGGAALMPENTLEAFANAEALGADAIETDVHLSRDGEVMVFHDDDTARLCGVAGTIEGRTRAELSDLDAAWGFTRDGGATFPFRGKGVRIPTLAEALERFPKMRFNLDAKSRDPALAEALARVLRAAGTVDRVCVGSAFDDQAARLRRLLPEWARYLPTHAAVKHVVAALLPLVPDRWLDGDCDLAALDRIVGVLGYVRRAVLRHFARRGMALQLWTVDDEEEMHRLLDAGIHGVMTDRPDLLKRAMGR